MSGSRRTERNDGALPSGPSSGLTSKTSSLQEALSYHHDTHLHLVFDTMALPSTILTAPSDESAMNSLDEDNSEYASVADNSSIASPTAPHGDASSLEPDNADNAADGAAPVTGSNWAAEMPDRPSTPLGHTGAPLWSLLSKKKSVTGTLLLTRGNYAVVHASGPAFAPHSPLGSHAGPAGLFRLVKMVSHALAVLDEVVLEVDQDVECSPLALRLQQRSTGQLLTVPSVYLVSTLPGRVGTLARTDETVRSFHHSRAEIRLRRDPGSKIANAIDLADLTLGLGTVSHNSRKLGRVCNDADLDACLRLVSGVCRGTRTCPALAAAMHEAATLMLGIHGLGHMEAGRRLGSLFSPPATSSIRSATRLTRWQRRARPEILGRRVSCRAE